MEDAFRNQGFPFPPDPTIVVFLGREKLDHRTCTRLHVSTPSVRGSAFRRQCDRSSPGDAGAAWQSTRPLQYGITLLLHDGDLEDNTTLLPSMIGQSQAVLFPVDHVSHTAASLLKRVCRENSKPYVPLRSAGLGSFLAAVRGVALADAG